MSKTEQIRYGIFTTNSKGHKTRLDATRGSHGMSESVADYEVKRWLALGCDAFKELVGTIKVKG